MLHKVMSNNAMFLIMSLFPYSIANDYDVDILSRCFVFWIQLKYYSKISKSIRFSRDIS